MQHKTWSGLNHSTDVLDILSLVAMVVLEAAWTYCTFAHIMYNYDGCVCYMHMMTRSLCTEMVI